MGYFSIIRQAVYGKKVSTAAEAAVPRLPVAYHQASDNDFGAHTVLAAVAHPTTAEDAVPAVVDASATASPIIPTPGSKKYVKIQYLPTVYTEFRPRPAYGDSCSSGNGGDVTPINPYASRLGAYPLPACLASGQGITLQTNESTASPATSSGVSASPPTTPELTDSPDRGSAHTSTVKTPEASRQVGQILQDIVGYFPRVATESSSGSAAAATNSFGPEAFGGILPAYPLADHRNKPKIVTGARPYVHDSPYEIGVASTRGLALSGHFEARERSIDNALFGAHMKTFLTMTELVKAGIKARMAAGALKTILFEMSWEMRKFDGELIERDVKTVKGYLRGLDGFLSHLNSIAVADDTISIEGISARLCELEESVTADDLMLAVHLEATSNGESDKADSAPPFMPWRPATLFMPWRPATEGPKVKRTVSEFGTMILQMQMEHGYTSIPDLSYEDVIEAINKQLSALYALFLHITQDLSDVLGAPFQLKPSKIASASLRPKAVVAPPRLTILPDEMCAYRGATYTHASVAAVAVVDDLVWEMAEWGRIDKDLLAALTQAGDKGAINVKATITARDEALRLARDREKRKVAYHA